MRTGFSLVELSIVLVILGLLTGGILAGQSLIRAAELRSVSTEYQRYVTAVAAFRDKYFQAPGDMNNATAFWGKDATYCNAEATAITSPGTCNGDGDGRVTVTSAINATSQTYQFWRQLALAGLVEGAYTGATTATHGYDTVAGQNVPVARLANSTWIVNNYGTTSGNGTLYDMVYNNVLMVGTKESSTIYARAAAARPEEVWNIDTKLDDGRPAYGKLVIRFYGNAVGDNQCTINAANSADLESDYNLTYQGIVCGILFRQVF